MKLKIRIFLILFSIIYISFWAYEEFRHGNILEGVLFLMVITGGTLNLTVMLANKGKMPVLCKNEIYKELIEDYCHCPITEKSRLTFLADIFEIKGIIIVSIGDILIAIPILFFLITLAYESILYFLF